MGLVGLNKLCHVTNFNIFYLRRGYILTVKLLLILLASKNEENSVVQPSQLCPSTHSIPIPNLRVLLLLHKCLILMQ